MGDGEAGSEAGAPLGTYSYVLPGVQEKAVNALTEMLAKPYKRVASGIN